ncbi:Serine/threonine-protein kinase RIO1-like [Oopsacas minuta]|uniref:Serine/threonine-protein kinase RIO1 n=1 Tax=Oopsacas minuta TaxID=111878 RepID=A0AAV7KGJ4_9METZ|nr:Serine/threonine-protein kinase RIO1-like [Oopsacas minuta]
MYALSENECESDSYSDYDTDEYNDDIYERLHTLSSKSTDLTKTYNTLKSNPNTPNQSYRQHQQNKYTQHWSNKYAGMSKRIHVELYDGENLPHSTTNMLINRRNREERIVKKKDKSDRATIEQVLDPRTRIILFKLLNKGYLTEINGCISTGKEANVYHATGEPGDIAIKVYKTSILTFKDRDRYVTGEFRFRRGYCKHNPRKMVRLWAEKEMRNLTRIKQASIPCPAPYLLRSHVLIMEHIDEDNGNSAIKLKDAILTQETAADLYRECVLMMWSLYNKARLVHADLSEYNILYQHHHLVLIDVSQAVEHDHPNALLFLRNDCYNISKFFSKNNAMVMSVKELFGLITNLLIKEEDVEEYFEAAMERTAEKIEKGISNEEMIDEEVFKVAHIPRTLQEVVHYEKDTARTVDENRDLFYPLVTGLKQDLSGAQVHVSNSESCSELNSESEPESIEEIRDRKSHGNHPRDNMSREEWKACKKAIKEEQREKRKHKMPKHLKRRREKNGKNRK